MFASIEACDLVVTCATSKLKDEELQSTSMNLGFILDEIMRQKPAYTAGSYDQAEFAGEQINRLKLKALSLFRELASKVGTDYPLPARGSLAEAAS
jgi:hypothetical protein